MADMHPLVTSHENPKDALFHAIANSREDVLAVHSQYYSAHEHDFFEHGITFSNDNAFLTKMFTVNGADVGESLAKSLVKVTIITEQVCNNIAHLLSQLGTVPNPTTASIVQWLLEKQTERAIKYTKNLCKAISDFIGSVQGTINGIHTDKHWPIRALNSNWPNEVFSNIYQAASQTNALCSLLISHEIVTNSNTPLLDAITVQYNPANDGRMAYLISKNPSMLLYLLTSKNTPLAKGISDAYVSGLINDIRRRRTPNTSAYLAPACKGVDTVAQILAAVDENRSFKDTQTKEYVTDYFVKAATFI